MATRRGKDGYAKTRPRLTVSIPASALKSVRNKKFTLKSISSDDGFLKSCLNPHPRSYSSKNIL